MMLHLKGGLFVVLFVVYSFAVPIFKLILSIPSKTSRTLEPISDKARY